MLKYLGVSWSGYRLWLKHTSIDTEKRRECIKAKIQDIYDVRFAYDGDADCCLCVDGKGNVITGARILHICGRYMKE